LDVPLYVTGLFSAIETGHMSESNAIMFARKCTAIAMYNTLAKHSELKLQNKWLRRIIKIWTKKVFGRTKVRVTPNVATMAIAKAYEKIGLGTIFESDDHADGKGFHAGFNRLNFAGEKLVGFVLGKRKPTSQEIVTGLENKEVNVSGFVYSEIVDGVLKTISERTEETLNFWERNKLTTRRTWGYVKGFGRTFIKLLLENKWWTIWRMTK